jgi:predicted DNA-binding ribbon-helix-helix protein
MYSRRVDLFGHQTSLRLEPQFWALLAEIRRQTGVSLRTFIEIIAMTKPPGRSLASAMRVAIAAWFHPDPHQHEQWQRLGRIVPGRDGETVYGLFGPRIFSRAREATAAGAVVSDGS